MCFKSFGRQSSPQRRPLPPPQQFATQVTDSELLHWGTDLQNMIMTDHVEQSTEVFIKFWQSSVGQSSHPTAKLFRLVGTLRSGRIQGLSANLVNGHLAGSRNKHFFSPLDGC